LLAHFSVGPYAVALGVAWIAAGGSLLRSASWWRATALAVGSGAAVLACWFGWAFAHFGVHETLLSNSSATTLGTYHGSQLTKVALNLRDTLVPHFLRDFDKSLLVQSSPWGAWRDWFFECYHMNLIFAFGSVLWLVLAVILWRARKTVSARVTFFWIWFVTVVVVLGVAAVGDREVWGLAHICLQALVLLGVARVAGAWPQLARGWRLALLAGATVDFLLGIALQFGVQSYAFDRWLAPDRSPDETLRSYSQPAFTNLLGRVQNHLEFFRDTPAPSLALVLVGLAGIFIFTLVRLRPAAPDSAHHP
jgi:hypothetical protein